MTPTDGMLLRRVLGIALHTPEEAFLFGAFRRLLLLDAAVD